VTQKKTSLFTAPFRRVALLSATLRHHVYLFVDYSKAHGIKAAARHSLYMGKLIWKQSRQNKAVILSRNSKRHRGPLSNGGNPKFTIAFLSGEPNTPGHKYRITCLAECLPSKHYQVHVVLFGKDDLDTHLLETGPIDLLWIWRLPMSELLEPYFQKLRSYGTRIHYDVDDLMFNPDVAKTKLIDGIRSMKLQEDAVRTFYQKHRQMLLYADHASSPTNTLTSQLLYFTPWAWTVPNTFTSQDLIKARAARYQRSQDDFFRMGYASGSRTHQKDFATILPAICEILRKYPNARLVVYPLTLLLEEYPELKPFENQIEKRDMVPVEDLVYEYARYDVNLCPLETGNIFCECKSQLKFFEAALCKTPTIASPTEPFARYIQSGSNGFLADEPEEWVSCLETLLESRAARETMGGKAYRSVLWNFSPEHLRQSVEAVICHTLDPVATRQSDAYSLGRICRTQRHEAISLPDSELCYSAFQHANAKVTVVVPCYNYAHFLPQALDSVHEQSLTELDLVIVDDCSTDNSLETALSWIKDHQSRFGSVKLFKNTENSKLAKTRNAGVDFCETEFYFPLDPDNYLEESCLELLLSKLELEKCAFAYPSLASVGNARRMPMARDWSIHQLRNGNYIDAMALIRKSTWVCVGGYTHDPRITGWEDFEFWCKCAETSLYGCLCTEAIAYYRAHANSMLATITDQPGFLQSARMAMREIHPWLVLP